MELSLPPLLNFFTIDLQFKNGIQTMLTLLAGSLDNLKELDSMKKYGPAFRYHHIKCLVIPKEHLFERAQHNFFVHDEVEMVDACRVVDSVICLDNSENNFADKSKKQ